MNNVDVLNLEWSSTPNRDRIVSTLVSNYLRHQGYTVHEGCVFNGFELIRKLKPKLFFINGAIGAKINFELVKFAKSRGIHVVSLSAEGNFTEDKNVGIGPFFWGWNHTKKLVEDFNLVWSERVKRMILSEFPELKNRVRVSGGVGFDVYQITSKIAKDEFLAKYGKTDYKTVLGVGCWDFGTMYPEDYRHPEIVKRFSRDEIERFKKDRGLFNKIILQAVKNNPDVLFIFKEHPGRQLEYKSSAIEGIENYQNVLAFKREESVDKCINASDLWLIYESTTAMEAWLYGKNTFKLNPTGIDFKRNELHQGTPLLETYKELQNVLDNLKAGKYKEFKYSDIQKELVERIIQWTDGLNHVRAGNEMIKLISCPKAPKSKIYLAWILHSFKNQIMKSKATLPRFDSSELKDYAKSQMELQLAYYKTKQLSKKDLITLNGIL